MDVPLRPRSGQAYAEVIGDPVAHSKSPLIHKFWLEKLGIAGDYRATRMTPDDLPRHLHDRRRDADWVGCNVTMPLKEEVVPFLASLSREASQARAVNTVINGPGPDLVGHNTDVIALRELLGAAVAAFEPYENHVATYVQIIGAGGAARAAGVAAHQAGYGDIEVFARSPEKAHWIAGLLGAPFGEAIHLDDLGPIANEDDGPDEQRYSHVVINATSLGMVGNPPVPIDLARYGPDTVVVDLVYAPVETPLVRQARELGLEVVDGLQVLVAQAAAAFTLLFGADAPREHDAELRMLLLA